MRSDGLVVGRFEGKRVFSVGEFEGICELPSGFIVETFVGERTVGCFVGLVEGRSETGKFEGVVVTKGNKEGEPPEGGREGRIDGEFVRSTLGDKLGSGVGDDVASEGGRWKEVGPVEGKRDASGNIDGEFVGKEDGDFVEIPWEESGDCVGCCDGAKLGKVLGKPRGDMLGVSEGTPLGGEDGFA